MNIAPSRFRGLRLKQLLKASSASVVVIALCSCETTQPKLPYPPQYLKEPKVETPTGPYLHALSNIALPENVAGFQRRRVFSFDSDAQDVCVEYDLPDGSPKIQARVWIYPSPPIQGAGLFEVRVMEPVLQAVTDSEFKRLKQQIFTNTPNATLKQEGEPIHRENGHFYSGKFAKFECGKASDGANAARAYLYLFCYVHNAWAVKYRFDTADSANVDAKIQEFMQSWIWFPAKK